MIEQANTRRNDDRRARVGGISPRRERASCSGMSVSGYTDASLSVLVRKLRVAVLGAGYPAGSPNLDD